MPADAAPEELSERRREQILLAGLIEELTGTDKFTAADLARLERVRLILAARGISLRDPEAALWLAPVVCTSASQQARFLERFATLFDIPPEELVHGSPAPPVIAERPPAPWWRRHWRWLALGSVLAIGLGLAIWYSARIDRARSFTSEISIEIVERLVRSGPVPEAPAIPWVMIGVLALLFLLAAVALHRQWDRYWRARSIRDFSPYHVDARPLAFAAALPSLYGSSRLRHRLNGLRRHRAMPSPRIHVGRSIRATIKAGGRPILSFGTRPQSPDYVLLADRESPRDHLPVVAQILSRRFAEEGVSATAYDYFGDPRRLRQSFPVAAEAELTLDRVGSRHACARLLLLAEPSHCLDAKGRAAAWLADLPEERPVLLNPRREGSWDWRETELEEAGVRVFPAAPAGLVDYAETLQAAADEFHRRRRGGAEAAADLPMLLAPHRDALLDETAPAEAEISDFVADLELWLGREATVILRAAALFPLIEPALTVLLASRLQDEQGQALLTENRLLMLARLPWMRVGRMPGWLRGALVRGLAAGQLAVTLQTIQAFLSPVPDGPRGRLKLDFSQGDDPAARARLREWLRRNSTSVYNDPLLLGALDGRSPDELGRPMPSPAGVVGRTLVAIDGRRDGAALLATMVLAAGLVALLPSESPMPTPAKQEVSKHVEQVPPPDPRSLPTSPPPAPPITVPPSTGGDTLTGIDRRQRQRDERERQLAEKTDFERRMREEEYRQGFRTDEQRQQAEGRDRATGEQQGDSAGQSESEPAAAVIRTLTTSRAGVQIVSDFDVLGTFEIPLSMGFLALSDNYGDIGRAAALFTSARADLVAVDVLAQNDAPSGSQTLYRVITRLAETGVPRDAIAGNFSTVARGPAGLHVIIRVLCRNRAARSPGGSKRDVPPVRTCGAPAPS